MGGGPGLLNGRRNSQPFRDFGEIGSDGRSPRLELMYGPHSIILGHHRRLKSKDHTAMMTRARHVLIGTLVLVLLVAAISYEAISTRPVRQAIRVYTELITLGNRPDLSDSQRLGEARALCSARYLVSGALALGPEGGIAGLPRTINKNFQAWRHSKNVWICPTNRIGPVYQFIRENGDWRFDGLVGLLRPRGEIVPATELPETQAP